MSEEEADKELICYVKPNAPIDIRPAPVERAWMEATPDRYAYRCLPLNIANSFGWEIYCAESFQCAWNGGSAKEAINFGTTTEQARAQVSSHFGSGILTFHVHGLFHTPPGFDLYVTGPVNRPKHGIAPLTGIIETSWSPYTFTMNWLFTSKDHVVNFEKGEPFCMLFPVPHGLIEQFDPRLVPFSENKPLAQMHNEWVNSRNNFNKDLQVPGSQAVTDKWQKAYYRGVLPDGTDGSPDHSTRIRARPFRKG